MNYDYIKSLHIISVISWMAGMLYLPRLFVYHCSAQPGSEASEMLKVMERKLMRFIINPAMISTYFFGIWMLSILGMDYVKDEGWLHVKLTLVIGMTICQVFFSRWRKAFAQDRNMHSAKFFRIMNEVPTLLMIVIVLLVVVKPF